MSRKKGRTECKKKVSIEKNKKQSKNKMVYPLNESKSSCSIEENTTIPMDVDKGISYEISRSSSSSRAPVDQIQKEEQPIPKKRNMTIRSSLMSYPAEGYAVHLRKRSNQNVEYVGWDDCDDILNITPICTPREYIIHQNYHYQCAEDYLINEFIVLSIAGFLDPMEALNASLCSKKILQAWDKPEVWGERLISYLGGSARETVNTNHLPLCVLKSACLQITRAELALDYVAPLCASSTHNPHEAIWNTIVDEPSMYWSSSPGTKETPQTLVYFTRRLSTMIRKVHLYPYYHYYRRGRMWDENSIPGMKTFGWGNVRIRFYRGGILPLDIPADDVEERLRQQSDTELVYDKTFIAPPSSPSFPSDGHPTSDDDRPSPVRMNEDGSPQRDPLRGPLGQHNIEEKPGEPTKIDLGEWVGADWMIITLNNRQTEEYINLGWYFCIEKIFVEAGVLFPDEEPDLCADQALDVNKVQWWAKTPDFMRRRANLAFDRFVYHNWLTLMRPDLVVPVEDPM